MALIPVSADLKQFHKVEFKVDTAINEDTGTIVQDTLQIHGDTVLNHMQKVIETQDEGVKAALIALGWTPPQVAPWNNKKEA